MGPVFVMGVAVLGGMAAMLIYLLITRISYAHARVYTCFYLLPIVQGAIASVPSEPLTRPGAAPGIYASAYTKLAAIMGALARARLALLRNDTGAAAGFLQDGIRVEDSIGYIEPPRYDPRMSLLIEAGPGSVLCQ